MPKPIKDERSREEKFLDRVEKLIKNYENNQAGPYWINRAQVRSMMKKTGGFKKKRYVLTDEDRERLEAQRSGA